MGSKDKQALCLSSCTAVVPIEYSGASLFRRPWVVAKGLTTSTSNTESSESEEEDDFNPLLLDPTQWKDQDHYAVLGLRKLRYQASPQQIRKAYRQRVLTHHPDKQSPEEQKKGGDNFFKCIQIAYDILSDPKRRRSYDSVDPNFDEAVPPQSTSTRENFFSSFAPVFDENARWSVKQPVPRLGDDNSSLEEVETFYSFWYDFESWREFSYLDEEEKDKAECREERKWIEKQNKAMRQKRKKEEVARIRTLVDNAYSCDPRIKQFKEAEKAEKAAKKKAKEKAARLEAQEREKAEQERREKERIEREEREAELKAQAAVAKKEKEAHRKALKKERKTLKTTIKGFEYFTNDESAVVTKMQELDRLCEQLNLEQLQLLNQSLVSKSSEQAQALFEQEVRELDSRQEAKREASMATARSSVTESSSTSTAGPNSQWSPEELQLLVKAVKLYPAGTVKRWDTIATYVNTHSSQGCRNKTAKNVISQVKSMQKLEASDKEAQNKLAFSTFEQKQRQKVKGKPTAAEATPTTRYDAPLPWTAEEQKLLEQGLRSYPASQSDRWDRIAKLVGTRTRSECITRFKELVAKVKAKKTQPT